MRSLLTRLAAVSALASFAVACGGASNAATTNDPNDTGATSDDAAPAGDDAAIDAPAEAAPDADNGAPSTTYPALHPPAPQVMTLAGPVLTAPKLVPVYFSNEDMTIATEAQDFESKVGATQYWATATSEYGVGPATRGTPVELTEAAPNTLQDSDIQTWLTGKLNGNDPAFGTPDANTLYVLHYPPTTTITMPGGFGGGTASSCSDFGGYHSNVTLDAAHGTLDVPYVVVPECSGFGALKGIDEITGSESHELIEAATDPFPQTRPAYGEPDEAHLYWLFVLGGGETGDMCAQNPDAFTKFSELPYTVQRTWSNKSAKASHDPCVPALSGAYFNSAPVLTDDVALSLGGQTAHMKGVKIPVGATKTIDLDLFSDGDTGGPWNVEAKDFSALTGGTASLKLTLDRTSGQNGEKLHLTIDVLKANQYKAEPFMIVSSKGGKMNFWIGLVGN